MERGPVTLCAPVMAPDLRCLLCHFMLLDLSIANPEDFVAVSVRATDLLFSYAVLGQLWYPSTSLIVNGCHTPLCYFLKEFLKTLCYFFIKHLTELTSEAIWSSCGEIL